MLQTTETIIPSSSLNCTYSIKYAPSSAIFSPSPQHKSSPKMNLTKRKLLLTLFFILVIASLFRLLRITLTTSISSPKPLNKSRHSEPYYNTLLSEKEFRFLSNVVGERSPCNLLVFGLEDQYVKLSGVNGGGTTIFLEDRPEKITKMTGKSRGTRVFRVEYKTYAKEAYELLKNARKHSSCSLRSRVRKSMSKCRLALTGLPMQVLKTKWDVIVVDGPGGDGPESPGRMGAIFMASVLARAGNGTNVVVHDVDRTKEKWFSWEFLSEKNLVSSKGKFWNFRIPHQKNLISSKVFSPLL